jgi:hypothetical protein
MTDGQKIIGARGSKVLTGTGAHTSLTGYAFIAQEDTVLTVFEVGGVDSLTAYGLSGTTLKAGAYIVVPTGSKRGGWLRVW